MSAVEIIAQTGIALCGATAVRLSQDESAARRRWSSVLGLCGQPFWIVETAINHQWGVLAMTLLYTWSWGKGFWSNWVKPWRAARAAA